MEGKFEERKMEKEKGNFKNDDIEDKLVMYIA